MIDPGLPPERLGNYRLKKLLGRGGMGEVFLAWDERLERHVAVKRILPDPPPDERARARFRREAKAVARLSHPAIVQVFELLETETGDDCLVMEYVEGHGLAERIAEGSLGLGEVLRLAAEIADGLAEAHGKGLVHRDLKPENVRVTAAGRAKILDFGLARLLWSEGLDADSLERAATRSGALVGTVHAMSPEQASGRPVDHRSDLFALGGLLYEMLAGQAPFRGHNVLDMLRRITSEPPEPLAELRPGLPTGLVDLVEQLLAKEPVDRPQNARLVATALERLRVQRRITPESRLPRRLSRKARERGIPEVFQGSATKRERMHGRPNAEVFFRRTLSDAKKISNPTNATAGPTELAPPVVTPGCGPAEVGELPTGEIPAPAESGSIETVVRTLLLTDLVDSTRLVESLGDLRAAEVSARHDRMARDLLAQHHGLEIDKTDGFLLLFERPFAAVAYALAYHRALAELSTELSIELGGDHGGDRGGSFELRARAGLHLGEVVLRRNPPGDVSRGAKPLEVEGLAKPMAARVMSLAGARQTLMTQGVFDLTRRAATGDERWDDALRWLAHGEYLFKGVEEPVAIFEVGVRDIAPLTAPADGEKARRAVSISGEQMLGWRPAREQRIPRRAKWRLSERLGEGGFGEVWMAEHPSGERRVFKFCFEAAKLRALEREVTLFRLLKESLGQRDDIARVLDWNFDAAPYFLEVEHTEGGDLASWAEQQGGLGEVPLETRLELAAQVAEALGAAHSVGVLHKDIKPENVLIHHDVDGRPRARLTDFGIGALLDRSRLEEGGITALGFSQTLGETDSMAGSRRYMAPELLEGKPATVQADLYSLGVLLYQLVAGDFARALAAGWQRDIGDSLLERDIAQLLDGDPELRPTSAETVATALRRLDERRAEHAGRRRVERRRRQLRLVAVVGAVLLVVATVLLVQAERARRQAEQLQGRAEQAREQAEDLVGFMLGDLQENLRAIGRLDALEGAGQKALDYFAELEATENQLPTRTLAAHARALHQMGDVRMAQGELDAALALFRESLARSQALAERDPDDLDALFELAQSYFWVGSVHFRQRHLPEALRAMEAYLEHSQALHRRRGDDDSLLEVAYGHNNVGQVLMELGEISLATRHYQQALETSRQLVERDPESSARQARWFRALLQLAEVHRHEGQLEASIELYDQAHEAVRAQLDKEPEDTAIRRRLAIVYDRRAGTALALGDIESAVRLRRREIETLEGLRSVDPENAEWTQLLGFAHLDLAEALVWQQAFTEAAAALALAQDVAAQRIAAGDEDRQGTALRDRVRCSRAQLELLRGNPATARSVTAGVLSEESERFWEQSVEARLLLGRALELEGEDARAREHWNDAVRLVTEHAPETRYYLFLSLRARALLLAGRLDEARPMVFSLLGMGYRHPRFLEICRRAQPALCSAEALGGPAPAT